MFAPVIKDVNLVMHNVIVHCCTRSLLVLPVVIVFVVVSAVSQLPPFCPMAYTAICMFLQDVAVFHVNNYVYQRRKDLFLSSVAGHSNRRWSTFS